MTIFIFFIFSGIALGLLIVHSYFFRGRRITLNFFIFALIWTFLKISNDPPQSRSYLKPYEFLNQDIPVIFLFFTEVIGWIFTLYISWCIAEKILQRLIFFKRRIFSTLLMCSMIIMSISYSIETAAMNIGWWRWKIDHQTLKGLFVGGCSLHIVNIWLFFTVLFLTAFFLIECSRYKKTVWKTVFIFLPFTYSWAILQRGPRIPTVVEEIGAISIFLFLPLILLAFFNHLPFEYEDAKLAESNSHKKISVVLQEMPLLMMLFMISIVVDIDFFILRKPILLISAMQTIFILLLSIKKIPFYIVFILSLFVLLLGKEKMIIPILPTMVVFALWCVDKIKLKNVTSKEKEIP